MMEFNEFKNIFFQKAVEYGFKDCALDYQISKSFQVKIFEGEVLEYKNSSSEIIAFRGNIHQKMGYSFSEKMDINIIDDMLVNASFNAEVVGDNEKEILYKDEKNLKDINFNESLAELSVSHKINLAKTMESEALSLDKRVVSVDYCIFSSGESEIYISNNLGLNLYKKNNSALAYVACRFKENEKVKSHAQKWFGNNINDFDPKELSAKCVKQGLKYLDATSVPSGKYEVILQNEVMSDLLGNLITNFYAEYVQKGLSILKDKLGKEVASSIITIKDDAKFKHNLGNSIFDFEGISTQNKIIIENGILKNYLYNLKTAQKDEVESTGNGFKSSVKSYVVTSAINFYIEPLKNSYDNMVKEMTKGLIITEISGLHSGINSVSCDFSLSASGFYVEEGKVIHSVEQITIAGNFFDMLKDVIDVGNDLEFDYPSGNGTFGSPSIKVKSLDVAGV